ncbi:MAG: NAD-glutamate dehydrogenase [Acidimicrobiia bacterium]
MAEADGANAPEISVSDGVIALLESDVSSDRKEMLGPFSEMYLRRLPDAEVPDLTPTELLAEIQDLLNFVDERGNDERAIRIFQPTTERCGYETPGSVVQVVTDDGPFLVDSLTAVVLRSGHDVVRHLHPVVGTERAADGSLEAIVRARGAPRRESVQHFELADELTETEAIELIEAINGVLDDVAAAVSDFQPLRATVQKMIDGAKEGVHHYEYEEVSEAVSFLEWLLDDNFVFLGYRLYTIGDSEDGIRVSADFGSGLGILSLNGEEPNSALLAELPTYLQERYEGGDLLVITKTNRHSTVHRDARMDYIGLRRLDENGRMVAEMRLLGLFTSKAYMAPAAETPVLRRKLNQVLSDQDVIEGSHDFKSLVQIFETFPKDDLFAMKVPPLSEMLGELVETEESSAVRLFVRRDALNRFVSVLVTIPRDRFNADLRKNLQEMLLEAFGGSAIDYRLALGESGDARLHFSVWVEEGAPLDVDVAELERTVVAMARNWDDRVIEDLAKLVPEVEARRLGERWTVFFPEYYKNSTGLEVAAGDVLHINSLMESDSEIRVGLQNETSSINSPNLDLLTRITVYRESGKLNLSDMMPLLEDLGLVVVEEVPTRLTNEQGTFVHDFGVLTDERTQLDVERVGARIAASIEGVLTGESESDSLHRLLVSSDLSHDEIKILRAYRSYWRLVTPSFSIGYVDDALTSHPDLAEALVRLFEARFSQESNGAAEKKLDRAIRKGLNKVASLDEDRIIRGFHGLIKATVRTNMHIEGRSALSLKFISSRVPDMPEPTPEFEIYVYSRGVEGVHLRGGEVARGGIRWSDRREDYRTEVLGLMKAQMTKNVVIVPTGAKGGFVVKQSATPLKPTYDEVRDAYKVFIRGLLDVSDNRIGDEIVPPAGVVRHDGDDPYLVVAADKGTASFSDTANELSEEYGFWLDDAFASGGSAGYDHKALGITARGAWESVRRHFLDFGIDVNTDELTAVGVGDMSGDVFGNGMLLSKHLRVVAAFDHRHIFIDPEPDAASSWTERKRLFDTPRSSWDDYDRSLISEGGGVFPRTAKQVTLTPQMREALGTDAETATPNELIRSVLRSPVDLLWNGGIGTYVKARRETHGEVQDRSNDAVRVNARDLRCRVVGEGGNLGFTQRGRIEFDRHGGRIFADFIDNSGGVNASDREVNLKILLRTAEEAGDITRSERDEIIESVSDDVVERILYDNFLQAQIITQEAATSSRQVEFYSDLMDRLERDGVLNREIEFLPGTEEMAQRSREGRGMSRPEISVLLAYAKMSLTQHLSVSHLPDDPHFIDGLLEYFPDPIVERFKERILQHPLRRELVSTIVANQVLNSQGSTYYSTMRSLTGASAAAIVRAYRIARVVTDAQTRWTDVEALGNTVDSETTRVMLRDIDRLVNLVSRWYLIRPSERSIDEEIAIAAPDFARLAEGLPLVEVAGWREPYEKVAEELEERGVPADLAQRHAFQRALRRGPDIVDLAHIYDIDALEVAGIYTNATQRLYIEWLERQIRRLQAPTSFDRLAVESIIDDLQWLKRDVVAMLLDEHKGSVDAYFESWDRTQPRLQRWHQWISRDGIQDVSTGLIATRRLRQILLA